MRVCAIETYANNKARKMFIYFSPSRLHILCFSSSNQANGKRITINATASTYETFAHTQTRNNWKWQKWKWREKWMQRRRRGWTKKKQIYENKNERVFAKWENSFACAYLLKFESKCECWLVVWCRHWCAACANICFCVAFFAINFRLPTHVANECACECNCGIFSRRGIQILSALLAKVWCSILYGAKCSRCVCVRVRRNQLWIETDRQTERIVHDCTHCEIYYIDITISFKLHTR